jgi:hypothetical protein
MRTRMRMRTAFTGLIALLALTLSGILTAVAAAAPAVLSSGKTSGYPTDAAASTTSAASVIVIIAAIVVTAAVIAYAAFGLDRRGRTQLQVIDGAGETTGASAASSETARSEDERRKAA